MGYSMDRKRKKKHFIGGYEQVPPPGFLSAVEADVDRHGALVALGSVGALIALGRMKQHHESGSGMMDTIEGVVTGMILFSILDHVKRAGSSPINESPNRLRLRQ